MPPEAVKCLQVPKDLVLSKVQLDFRVQNDNLQKDTRFAEGDCRWIQDRRLK
jgi:hypothetical protein